MKFQNFYFIQCILSTFFEFEFTSNIAPNDKLNTLVIERIFHLQFYPYISQYVGNVKKKRSKTTTQRDNKVAFLTSWCGSSFFFNKSLQVYM